MEINNLLTSLNQLTKAINNVSNDLKPQIEQIKSELTEKDLVILEKKQAELNQLLQQANILGNGY